MDDVLEILVENGELPPSAVGEATVTPSLDTSYVSNGPTTFAPTDVLTDDVLNDNHVRDSLAADELQRELDDIQNEIMNHADLQAVNASNRCQVDSSTTDIDTDITVDLLSNGEFHTDFGSDPNSVDNDDFFGSLLSCDGGDRIEDKSQAMDIGEDVPERMSMTPLTNGDILDHTRTGFEYMDDLSLPSFQNEESRHDTFGERACEFDLKEFGIDTAAHMTVDGDACDYMDTELIPNLFGRGHVPQCDPLLGGVAARAAPLAPRPRKHYSWDRIEYDAT